MQPIRLVVGLGNPGREHAATRHNAGFWFADALAATLGATFRSEAKFQGQVAKAADGLRLLKPGTYMNLSGRPVASLSRFSRCRRKTSSSFTTSSTCCPVRRR
jgi:PTH1 family peptidyl-tRNA hydrolase